MLLPRHLRLDLRPSLPILTGSEAAECGLVCLAMVSQFHGAGVSLNELRLRFPISMSGLRLTDLMRFAGALGLEATPVRIELDDLERLDQPTILHWGLNHFVVLKAVTRRGALIHDPATGARVVGPEELSRQFSGAALILEPGQSFQPKRTQSDISLRQFAPRIRGWWSSAGFVVALSVALQVLTLALPFQIQIVVDHGLSRSDDGLLLLVALGFGTIAVMVAASEAVRNWSLQILGNAFSFQLVAGLVRHLLRLPMAYFEKRHLGDTLSRLGAVAAIQEFLTRGVLSALLDGCMALIAAIILFIYAPLLATIVLAAVAASFLVGWAFYYPSRRATERRIALAASEQTYLMETIRSIVTIKVMGGESQREVGWRKLFSSVVAASQANSGYQILASSIQASIGSLQLVLVIFLGARMVLAAEGFSVGMLMAFIGFRQVLTDRANALSGQFVQLKMLGLHFNRISDIVENEPELADDEDELIVDLTDSIRLEGVGFRYGVSDAMVLQDVNLTIGKGEFVAIVGPTGGGKTTLLKLLLGLREPTSGGIFVDNKPMTAGRWRRLRSQVGLVAQDDVLLSGSIAENIAFFDHDMRLEHVIACSKAVGLHEQIAAMSMQYRSLVADAGRNLSGGQRQRLLLARALYRNPSILILDEGTANLDPQTEARIVELLEEMNTTRIIVAHRPAMVESAARVLWVEDGKVRDLSGSPLGSARAAD